MNSGIKYESKQWWIGFCASAIFGLYMLIAMWVFAFRHPQLTNTQIFLHTLDALRFKKLSVNVDKHSYFAATTFSNTSRNDLVQIAVGVDTALIEFKVDRKSSHDKEWVIPDSIDGLILTPNCKPTPGDIPYLAKINDTTFVLMYLPAGWVRSNLDTL